MLDIELKDIEEKEQEFSELFTRMDADKALVFLEAFQMKSLKTGVALKRVDNVTLPDPAIFVGRVMGLLSSADPQTEVEGEELSDKETTLVEDFLAAMAYEIDSRLIKLGRTPLFRFCVGQACLRGYLITRNCLRALGDTLIPDVLPCDARFVIYEVGMDGYVWVANKTTRSKAMIQAEYKKEIQTATETVWDFWDAKVNRIWIGREEAKQQRNPYGYPPFTIVEAPTGLHLGDSDAKAHRGESLLSLSRTVYPYLNQIMTIYLTRGRQVLRPGMQYASDEGEASQRPKQLEEHPADTDVITPVEKGGGYLPVNQVGVDASIQLAWNVLDSRKQEGSLSQTDYGNLQFPLSSLALGRLMEQHNQITLPVLQALAISAQQNMEMWISQYKMLKRAFKLGETGHKKSFQPGSLEGDFTIKQRYFASSPEMDMANYSTAAAAGNMISDDRKRRDIIKLKDPDGEMTKIRSEQAEKLDPAIALYRQMHDLIDEGKNAEAWLTLESLKMTLRTRFQAALPAAAQNIPAPAEVTQQPMNPEIIQKGGQGRGPQQNQQLLEAQRGKAA